MDADAAGTARLPGWPAGGSKDWACRQLSSRKKKQKSGTLRFNSEYFCSGKGRKAGASERMAKFLSANKE